MSQQFYVRRDTSTWVLQVWLAFAMSLILCGYGIWNMPSESLDRAFLATGFFFCLSTCFALAKSIRDNQNEQVDTGSWRMQVWIAFFIAVALTAWGLYRMKIGDWEKGYMLASWLFLISSTFTLSKTIRDNHDADLLEQSSAVQGSSRSKEQ
ncbi:MAG: YiaA/YiaB family inner membrane protein [Pseudomonadota bacterium]